MPANRYNRAFINRFREELIAYPIAEEQQYDYVLFRQYTGKEQELDVLAKHLNNSIHDAPVIGRLIDSMENTTIPESIRLSDFIKGVKNLFGGYAESEPYTSTYYNHLVLALDDLREQAETFQKDTQTHLLDKLKTPFDAAHDQCLDIDSDVIRKIDDVIEYYLDNFEAYDSYFNSMIRQEEQKSNGQSVTVTSQVAYYLSKLVSLTDSIIMHLYDTREILFDWEKQFENRESQELYN